MRQRLLFGALMIALAAMVAAPAQAQLSLYIQDFEGLNQADPGALDADGWFVFGNVFDNSGTTFFYGYGPFGAPNGGPGFSAIDAGQGGVEQGAQQLSVYNDYNNGDHANGFLIESNVFQERTIAATDVGRTYTFTFDAKAGNINDPTFTCDPPCQSCPCSTTAIAFIKTLDPLNGFALTNFVTLDTTSLPTTWGTYELELEIDAGLVGQIFQFGFASTATFFQPSGNFYDNIRFGQASVEPIPTMSEWGVIITGLLLLVVGTVGLMRAQPMLAGAGAASVSFDERRSLFVPGLFALTLAASAALALFGLAAAFWLGNPPTRVDMVGSLLSVPIAAYLLHLWISVIRKQ